MLREFFEKMTTEQRSSIEIVTADGARWISDLVEEYLPNVTMCVDSFHVVQWINDALDELRIEAWREALGEVASLSKGRKPRRGRPAKDDAVATQIAEARKNASDIKGSLYALGKNPEHLTERQKTRLEWLAKNNERLYRAFGRKEQLRLILHMDDVDEADEELKNWLWWASHSRIKPFIELGRKIRRHKARILNTIRMGMSNARIEATNNKIKLLVKRAYGFRNVQNLIDLILLVCSDLKIILPNRASGSVEIEKA